jgi:hypothetical protein
VLALLLGKILIFLWPVLALWGFIYAVYRASVQQARRANPDPTWK